MKPLPSHLQVCLPFLFYRVRKPTTSILFTRILILFVMIIQDLRVFFWILTVFVFFAVVGHSDKIDLILIGMIVNEARLWV